ncbi:hypothetical protein GCM10027299_46180 [Larkinella ripae]
MVTSDPFSPHVALFELLLLIAFAALAGYALARFTTSSRINALRDTLADQEAALDECQRKRRKRALICIPARSVLKPVEKQ